MATSSIKSTAHAPIVASVTGENMTLTADTSTNMGISYTFPANCICGVRARVSGSTITDVWLTTSSAGAPETHKSYVYAHNDGQSCSFTAYNTSSLTLYVWGKCSSNSTSSGLIRAWYIPL